MYITIKEVLDLKSEVQHELDDFEYGRGADRVPTIKGEDRIILQYVIDLLIKLEKMLKRGNYEKSRLLDALKNQDWSWYSFNDKSLWTEKALRKRLNIKRKMDGYDLLLLQSKYLEKAGAYIIARLED